MSNNGQFEGDKILTSENISLTDFREFLFKKIVPVKELLDYKGAPLEKIISFWRRKDLIPFVANGDWLKISFAQLIWVRILDDLRKINFPVEKMKTVCDYFFWDAYNDELPKKNFQFNKNKIEKKISVGSQTDEDVKLLDYINSCLDNKSLIDSFRFDINYLTNLVTSVIAEGNDGAIYIFFDGTVAEFVGNNYIGHKNTDFHYTDPYIHLSVTNYLKEFIKHDQLSDILMTQLLNEDEIKVLSEMRRRNVKEIIITTEGDNKKKVSISKTGIIADEKAQQIKQILGLKNYESILLNTIDEKSFSFKRTRKKI